ncbi:major facilitator family transmembrane efflux protein [Corynebacterium kutscheri]|uniref:DHA2 family efflux MFS transporter permease subunit n=1 Tax=Corynebacterium kutscheri TaxID=35755 RepID=UPI000F6EAA83|nr:DHA2 family efflux MFS transporter permease subunit [Corynebacterium kutscheri]VEH79396.1 major facilitator family transmembrane efflux protein [Corynebacterium kutscheri]
MARVKEIPALPMPEKDAWPALIALCIGFFMILLDQTIVAVATPMLQESFSASYNQIIWVTSAYLLTFAVPLLVTGRLGDRYGPKNIYILGMVIFTISSLACGFASNIYVLIVARVVQGVGAALLTPQTMSVINRIFARQRRGAALGVWGIVGGLASLAGPLLGGFITQTLGWEWIFFINVPIGAISVISVWWLVPDFLKTTRKIDPLSIALSIIAVFTIVFALQQGEEANWAWWIWALLGLGIAVSYIFVRQQSQAELRGNDPLMPLSLFTMKNFSMGTIGIITMGFMVAGTPLPLMLFLQQIHGLSALSAGLMIVPQAVVGIILSPIVGRMADHYSPNVLATIGFGTSAVVMFLLFIVMTVHADLWTIPVVMFLLGVSTCFVWSPNSTATMRDLPPLSMGVGSGVYNTARQVGSVTGSAAIGAVLQWRIGAGDAGAAYGQSMLLAGIVLAIGALAAWRAYRL